MNSNTIDFPVWKTIRLGLPGIEDVWETLGALRKNQDYVTFQGHCLLRRMPSVLSPESKEIDLVLIAPYQLPPGENEEAWLDKDPKISDFYKRVQRFGYHLCSPEIGPLLRLQYGNQPYGENLLIGMDPLYCDQDQGRILVFMLSQDEDGSILGSCNSHPDVETSHKRCRVFVKPRKQETAV